jgi:hypothetical protein
MSLEQQNNNAIPTITPKRKRTTSSSDNVDVINKRTRRSTSLSLANSSVNSSQKRTLEPEQATKIGKLKKKETENNKINSGRELIQTLVISPPAISAVGSVATETVISTKKYIYFILYNFLFTAI